jgi:hypothetical protein
LIQVEKYIYLECQIQEKKQTNTIASIKNNYKLAVLTTGKKTNKYNCNSFPIETTNPYEIHGN